MRLDPGGGGDQIMVDPPIVGATGKEIVGDALELTNSGPNSMDDFQTTLNSISQNYFPYQLQPALQAFIKAHYTGYTTTVLKDREEVGDALQTNVAKQAEITDIQTADLFKQ